MSTKQVTKESLVERFVSSITWQVFETGQGHSQLETDGYEFDFAWYEEKDSAAWVFWLAIKDESALVELDSRFDGKANAEPDSLKQEMHESLVKDYHLVLKELS